MLSLRGPVNVRFAFDTFRKSRANFCGRTMPVERGRAIDLNHAEAGDLMALPGMTFRKAHALVGTRTKRGSFKTIDDMPAIPGFTRNYVYRIQDLIEIH